MALTLYQTTILDWAKLGAFADNRINVTEKIEISSGKGRKHGGKRKNDGYHHFLLF